MALVTTAETGELGLTATIPFVHKATTGTGPTGVVRVDQHQWDTCSLRFVVQEVSQLPKAPVILLRPLPLTNRHPVAYTGQVFEDQNLGKPVGPVDQTSCPP